MYRFNVRRMKAERIARGISIAEMATKLEMAPGTYSKKENGHIRITVDDLAKIFEVLNIPEKECGIFFTVEVAKMTT
ncbi:helix-turn-helix domain-containing protein [Staphylococcus coagulans]|uniref:helix-turn-helix domain-containing protein n=1 Tax=Staphylococcus coagulans TaxID=74706 RepID=UPI003364D1DE